MKKVTGSALSRCRHFVFRALGRVIPVDSSLDFGLYRTVVVICSGARCCISRGVSQLANERLTGRVECVPCGTQCPTPDTAEDEGSVLSVILILLSS